MASGGGVITFDKSDKTSSGSYVLGKVEYEYTQSTLDNTSTVIFNVYVKKDNDSTKLTQTTNGTFKYSLTINGESTPITGSKSLEILTSYKKIGSFTKTIKHNDNGSKNLSIVGDVWLSNNTSSAYYNRKSHIDDSITLETIPRASSITSAANVTLGSKCSIKWTPMASSFAYKVKLSCGDVTHTSDYITPGSTSVCTYSATMSLSYWAGAIPNSYSGTCKATLYTYSSSSSDDPIGSSSASFTITIPSHHKVSISNMLIGWVKDWNGYYIQGKSKCELSAYFTAGIGSSIQSCSISGPGLSLKGTGTSLSGTTSVLAKSGYNTYTIEVADGRSTAKDSIDIYVWPYAKPVLSTFTAARTSTSGQVKITYKASCSSVNSENKLTTLKIYRKPSTVDAWPSSPTETLTLDASSVSSSVLLNNYDTTSSFDFKAEVADSLGNSSVEAMASITSEFRILNISEDRKRMSIGKMAADNTDDKLFDCALPARFLDNIEFTSNNGSVYGSLEVDYNDSGNNIVYIRNGQDVDGGASMALAIHKASVYVPGDLNDGLVNLGSSSRKWNQLYAKSETISTSDRSVKTDISSMSDTQEQLFNKLQPVTFKFANGSSGRTHYGFISQDVEESLGELNLTGQDFAGFCKDLRVDDNGEAILDENNKKIYDYALRYSEFIALNTYMIQKLQTENKELKAELQALKEMITNINASSNSAE